MTILHLITGLSAGGAERSLYNLLAGGLADRFPSAVVSLMPEGRFGPKIRALGVPVVTLAMRRGVPGATAVVKLAWVVRKYQPDLIQGWMYHGNLAASLAGRFPFKDSAVVWNGRHSLYNLADEARQTQIIIRFQRLLSGRVDGILYNSRVARFQHEAFGFDGRRGCVIPNGVDLSFFRPNASVGSEIRAELHLPDTNSVIGHIARYHPMKDHACFLRAAVIVAKSYPAARFVLAGREVDLRNPALRGIVPPEFEDRFVFTGEREDPERLLQAMDILTTSSAWGEGFPNVLGEAMACGVPCVTTDVGDSADIVGNTGIIVPPSNPKSLADGLLQMLQKAPEERRSLGEQARSRIARLFALPQIVEQYANLYESLMNNR